MPAVGEVKLPGLLFNKRCKNRSFFRATIFVKCGLLLLVVAGFATSLNYSLYAQKEKSSSGNSSLCDSVSAVSLIREQVQISKTFDNSVPRISVLIRAADLLWEGREAEARNAFAEAFEIAKRDYKERGDKPTRAGSRYPELTSDTV